MADVISHDNFRYNTYLTQWYFVTLAIKNVLIDNIMALWLLP